MALTMGDEKVKGVQGGLDAAAGTLLLKELEAAGDEVAVDTGTEEKLKVGREAELMGRETGGKSGTSTISSSGAGLVEARMPLSLFIFPPEPRESVPLAAGVLDKGYRPLVL